MKRLIMNHLSEMGYVELLGWKLVPALFAWRWSSYGDSSNKEREREIWRRGPRVEAVTNRERDMEEREK